MMNENVGTYLIPNNFIDEGRVFNGAIRTRYLIEAIIIFVVIAGPCWLLIPKEVGAKLGITLGLSLPLTMLAIVGINGDSLSGFIKAAWAWKKQRQIMLYNDNARTYQARPVDVMLSEVYASDVLLNSLEKWRNQRAHQNANVELIENIDFVFVEDEEYEKMIPQDIREQRKREKKEAERAKKKKKKKDQLAMLPSPSILKGNPEAEAEMAKDEVTREAVEKLEKVSEEFSFMGEQTEADKAVSDISSEDVLFFDDSVPSKEESFTFEEFTAFDENELARERETSAKSESITEEELPDDSSVANGEGEGDPIKATPDGDDFLDSNEQNSQRKRTRKRNRKRSKGGVTNHEE